MTLQQFTVYIYTQIYILYCTSTYTVPLYTVSSEQYSYALYTAFKVSVQWKGKRIAPLTQSTRIKVHGIRSCGSDGQSASCWLDCSVSMVGCWWHWLDRWSVAGDNEGRSASPTQWSDSSFERAVCGNLSGSLLSTEQTLKNNEIPW